MLRRFHPASPGADRRPRRPGPVPLRERRGNDYLENKAIAEGRIAPPHFPATCPDWSEEEAINRVIKMGALTGASVYVVHLSTQLGLERIKQAQAQGQRVWTETCPQYLLLNEQAMERWGPLAKIGPPLRRADGPGPRGAVAAAWRRASSPAWPATMRRGPEGQGARVEEHLRRSRGPVHSVRRARPGDRDAARVQRGRRQAGAAHHVAGPGDGGEPGANLRPLSPQGRRSARAPMPTC